MLLLLGGLFTFLFSTEGYMDLSPNIKKSYSADYHAREFVILDNNNVPVKITPHTEVNKQHKIKVLNNLIEIKTLSSCRNCAIEGRDEHDQDKTYHGMAQHMALQASPLRKLNEENLAGLTIEVTGSDTQDGVYVLLEDVPQYPHIKKGGKSYRLKLRRKQRTLPFSLELIDFKRDTHPGTTMAKSYESRVRIHDKGAMWEAVIKMNEPLRYRGYTFFQSSFIETPDGDISVLAVVWNAGRIFPYISSLAMCLGMIIHLIIRRRKMTITQRGAHDN